MYCNISAATSDPITIGDGSFSIVAALIATSSVIIEGSRPASTTKAEKEPAADGNISGTSLLRAYVIQSARASDVWNSSGVRIAGSSCVITLRAVG